MAGDKLDTTSDALSAIALSLGYESESAFSTAFKGVMACSPRQYGRERSQTSAFPVNAQAARENRLESMAG